ncbi:hypothetical protein P9112_006633 [Eukaryota sp. TZLM1-RC]
MRVEKLPEQATRSRKWGHKYIHSESRVFTRSCALNSLLTLAAVQQIRTDLPLVTEICHEASLVLQSFRLVYPLASRALVKQDVWYPVITIITTGFFPKPSTSKGQRQLLHIFYSGFLPECPQDRSLVSSWENSFVPYRNSFNLFLNGCSLRIVILPVEKGFPLTLLVGLVNWRPT